MLLLFLLSHHLCWTQRHCFCAAHPSISTSSHTKTNSIAALPPEVHRRCQIIGGLSSDRDTAPLQSHFSGLVFSSVCSDSTPCRTPPNIPLQITVLFKLWSQTEWVFPKRADCHYIPPPVLLCGLSDGEDFDQNCLRQGRRLEHWDKSPWKHGVMGSRNWDFFFNAVINEVEDDNWWCCRGPFWLETTWLGCRVVIIL